MHELTHDLNLARRFATHAALFAGGDVVVHGPVEDVMQTDALSTAFGYPVLEVAASGHTVFVPA